MINCKTRKLFVTVLILTLLVSIPLSSVYGDPNDWFPEMTRFGGTDRYETSALVSEYLFETSDYVVIAREMKRGTMQMRWPEATWPDSEKHLCF